MSHGPFLWPAVLANIPRHQAIWVNYKNDDRAPLLFIAGGSDHIMPPSVNKANAHLYQSSKAITDSTNSPAAPLDLRRAGWEAVADYALEWAERTSSARAV